MAARKSSGSTSGLEQLPPIFSRPVWKDRFFHLFVAMLVAWGLVLYWLFF